MEKEKVGQSHVVGIENLAVMTGRRLFAGALFMRYVFGEGALFIGRLEGGEVDVRYSGEPHPDRGIAAMCEDEGY